MLCVIAFFVFGFLSIFSAKYRLLAKEAFLCVFRRLTLRPCESGLEERIKADLTGRLLSRSPKLARWAEKLYEPLAWFLIITFFISLFFLLRGAYYYLTTGSCDPVNPLSCPIRRIP